ncbi:hypothetical protein JHK82_050392 [Glycine max]|nr:hypothetical protein JHK82_050392 [Glycine max]
MSSSMRSRRVLQSSIVCWFSGSVVKVKRKTQVQWFTFVVKARASMPLLQLVTVFKHHLVGTRWDSEPCPLVSEEVKMFFLKVVAEVANASEKKRKLNNIYEEGKAKFVRASGEGIQASLNQLYKKGDKDKVNDKCAEFWYTSIEAFEKSNGEIELMLQEFRDEWKRTGCTIMFDGFEPVWKIIDERWDHQLHSPLHATAYYLNPHLHYEPRFKHDDPQVKRGMHMCMRRLVKDVVERKKINLQPVEFHFARGLFSMEEAKDTRKVMQLGEWWEMFGDGTPELRRFFIRVLSLTCSSSGCECNWSSFEMLKSKQNRKGITLPFDKIEFNDEWITEEGYNDEDEQPQGEDDGGNVEYEGNIIYTNTKKIFLFVELVGDVGGSSNDPFVEAFDLDNLIFLEPNDDAQSEEDLADDGDGDETDDIHENDLFKDWTWFFEDICGFLVI